MNRSSQPGFDEDFDPDMDVEGDVDSFFKFAKAWFVFVALLALSLLVGGVYVVYLLLAHFGVIA